MSSRFLSKELIRDTALRLGFSHCGVAPAEPVDEHFAQAFSRWIAEGKQGEMHYLENYFEKRMDPRLLVEGTRSIISVAMNYRPDKVAPGIAWYAQGRDYHDLMRERLTRLMEELSLEGRVFVDTAPVPERYWAVRCGLGWLGRHGQLVIPGQGSAFFLGELFVTSKVDEYDSPMPDRCGTCRRCVDACPMHCIGLADDDSRTIDARRCLSYLTIENRGELPEGLSEQMGSMFYGCDRCLQACPHLHASPTTEAELHPSDALLAMTPDAWQNLTREQYQQLFKGSAVKRAKYEGLMRNVQEINKK